MNTRYSLTNGHIAYHLQKIAGLLQFVENTTYRAESYQSAADTISQLSEPILIAAEAGKLSSLPEIGSSISAVIQELLETSTSQIYESLRQQASPSLLELVQIPGIGLKTARRLFQELQIQSITELEEACKTHRLQTISGMGPKSEAKIAKAIVAYQKASGSVLLASAHRLGEEIQQHLLATGKQNVHVTLAGSARRMKETVEQVEIVLSCSEDFVDTLRQKVRAMQRIVHVVQDVELPWTYEMLMNRVLVLVQFWWVPLSTYGLGLIQHTGSIGHVAALTKHMQNRALTRSEYRTETEFYEELGLSYIPPEIREGTMEVELAEAQKIPRLIEMSDFLCDLHLHSIWSDGSQSIEEIALHLQKRGLSYLAITDHSRSLSIAGGLSIERLFQQKNEIEALNRRLKNFTVLCGVEMDILPDASLDYPDEVLAELDFVIASIHSAFYQSQEQLTRRILEACKNPYVNLIGHPHGRLLSRRPPYELDLGQIFKVAAETGTALEINSSPNRLDLPAKEAREARNAGVKLAINTDAHHPSEFEYLVYGVGTARRAWLTQEDVMNTWSLEQLRQFVAKKRTLIPRTIENKE